MQAISNINITKEHSEWVLQVLKDSFKDEKAYSEERLKSLHAQKQILRDRIDNIYLDKLDKKISEEFWQEKHNKWTQELLTIQNNITAFEKANINFIEQGANFLRICTDAEDLYKYGDNSEYSFSDTFKIGF